MHQVAIFTMGECGNPHLIDVNRSIHKANNQKRRPLLAVPIDDAIAKQILLTSLGFIPQN